MIILFDHGYVGLIVIIKVMIIIITIIIIIVVITIIMIMTIDLFLQDFVVTVIFTLFWLISSAAFAAALTKIKNSADPSWLGSCYSECTSSQDGNYSTLNVSVVSSKCKSTFHYFFTDAPKSL